MMDAKGCDHHAQWVQAAKAHDRKAPGSNFEYSVPMIQMILLGCAALRFPGKTLKWDNKKHQFSNLPEADQWLSSNPRASYVLSV